VLILQAEAGVRRGGDPLNVCQKGDTIRGSTEPRPLPVGTIITRESMKTGLGRCHDPMAELAVSRCRTNVKYERAVDHKMILATGRSSCLIFPHVILRMTSDWLVVRVEGISKRCRIELFGSSSAAARRAAATAARNCRSGHAAWAPVPTRRPGRPPDRANHRPCPHDPPRPSPRPSRPAVPLRSFAPPAGDSGLRDGGGVPRTGGQGLVWKLDDQAGQGWRGSQRMSLRRERGWPSRDNLRQIIANGNRHSLSSAS
jgi:hypothetical protein